MVIGIMGGTFDPVHLGHLNIAEAAQTQLGCDRILWIPTGLPPHKTTAVSNEDRVAMLRLAIDGLSGHAVDLCEMEREGYSRTVDTLKDLHARYPDAEFFFIIGGDTVMQLEGWKDFPTVAKLTSFAVNLRPDTDDASVLTELDRLKSTYGLTFQRLTLPHIPISSSGIRVACAEGKDFSEQVPPSVYAYIKEHNLYKELVE